MTTDLEELRKLAEKATPGDGPVFAVGDGRPAFALADASRVSLLTIVSEGETDFAGFYEEADAAYFNAVRPATILALVSELEALREAVSVAAARDVLAERKRQVETEGWIPAHDDEHTAFELARAAAAYALWGTGVPLNGQRHVGSFATIPYSIWPWGDEWWKPTGRRRNLIKAAALILAEIERLDRAALTKNGS